MDVPRRSSCVARVAAAGVTDGPADPTLVVVTRPEVGVAEPVVGDVDPLRTLESVRPGDVGMVLAEERAPGQLDDLGARVDGDLEAGVEVVGGERWDGVAQPES